METTTPPSLNPVTAIKSELKSHKLLWLLPLVFILGLGFGRFSAPSQVKTVTTITASSQTKEQQTQTQAVAQVEQKTQVATAQQNQNLVTDTSEDITKKPDGTVIVHKETHEHEATQSVQTSQVLQKETIAATTVTKQQETVATTETETKSKTVTYDKPKWLLTPMVGVNLGFVNGKTNFGQSIVGGVGLQHQFIGPVYLGGFGVTNGTLQGSVIGISGTIAF